MPSLETDKAALDLEGIALRVRQMLASAGVDGTDFATRIGVPYSTMRAYMAGSRAPSAEFLVGCYRAFGFMPAWLLTGEGAVDVQGTRTIESVSTLDRDYVVVPVLAVRASAGPGVLNEPAAEYRVSGMCLANSWLAQRRLSPANLAVIHVRGSSMQGVLADGDRVLVDQSDTTPRSGFVYVLRQGDELLVKYCQLQPGGILRVSSANPAFQSYEVDLSKASDVSVVGRVVASMHDW